jgi:hypothetical protein
MDNGFHGEDTIEPGYRLARGSPPQSFRTRASGLESEVDLFADLSGFYLLPCVVPTYALAGQARMLREQLTRNHLSVISGIGLEGKLFMMEQKRTFKGEDVWRVLKHLLHQISGKLLVVWDGPPIYREFRIESLQWISS